MSIRILPSIERASKENFCWASRACCSIYIILAINCSSFSWLCLRKERMALVSSCALSFDAPFPFLQLLLVLAHFRAAFFLLTPPDDLEKIMIGKITLEHWKNNDLEKATSWSSESEFGDCDLGMLLVPDDASDRTFFEASIISLSKALFSTSSWFKATSLLSRTCCGSTDSLPPSTSSISWKFCGINSFGSLCSLKSASSSGSPPLPKPVDPSLSLTVLYFFLKLASYPYIALGSSRKTLAALNTCYVTLQPPLATRGRNKLYILISVRFPRRLLSGISPRFRTTCSFSFRWLQQAQPQPWEVAVE